MRDFCAFFYFFLLAGRFSIGCGSKFRAEVAYLEVGSSDLEPIHEKNHFHEISDIFMKSRIYSWVKPGRPPKPGRAPKPGSVLGGASPPPKPPLRPSRRGLVGATPPPTRCQALAHVQGLAHVQVSAFPEIKSQKCAAGRIFVI